MSLCPGGRSQEKEGIRHASFVSQFPEEVQALADQFICSLWVVQDKGQMCCRIEYPGPYRCCYTLTKHKGLFQEVLALSAVPTNVPEPGQRGTEAQGLLRPLLALLPSHTCLFQQPGEGRSQVLMLLFQASHPSTLLVCL